MHFSCADGTERDVADMCTCCQMTTGEQHQGDCPMSQKPRVIGYETYPEYKEKDELAAKGYKALYEENWRLAEELFVVGVEMWPDY